MLWVVPLLIISSVYSASIRDNRAAFPVSSGVSNTGLVPQSRQQSPVNAALTGLFSPPFIVLVGLGALAHTVERFVTDIVKSSNQELRKRRKKKKPQEPIKPFPPLRIARPPPPAPASLAEMPVAAAEHVSTRSRRR